MPLGIIARAAVLRKRHVPASSYRWHCSIRITRNVSSLRGGATRPPLAQTFEALATGERFTAVTMHFKSKRCSGASGGDADQGDEQGCYNATRSQMATELTNWLAADPTGSGAPDFLIIGDLNAYAMEDPITALESAGYVRPGRRLTRRRRLLIRLLRAGRVP